MNRKLFDLAYANQGKGAPLRAEVKDDVATIYVYDVIDSYWGVSASDMAKTLAGITAPNIVVRINSPGGDVFEARAMMAQLVGHSATVTAKIDGLAASAASFLAMAASSVEIADGGFFMIHKGWTWMMGNADDCRATASLLDKVDASIIDTYAGKTGKSVEDISAWMKEETWFNAEEAVAEGFCDTIIPTTAAAKASARNFNLGVFEKTPKALIKPEPVDIDDGVRDRMMARLNLYERT